VVESEHFNPGSRYASLAAWKAEMKQMITNKASVRNAISNVKITRLPKNRARVEFDQRHRTGAIMRSDSKLLLMEKNDSGWKIIREIAAIPDSRQSSL